MITLTIDCQSLEEARLLLKAYDTLLAERDAARCLREFETLELEGLLERAKKIAARQGSSCPDT